MTVALVVGTRPEAIKLAPIAELLGEHALVVHTGQHYSVGMTGQLQGGLLLARSANRALTRGQQLGYLTGELDQSFNEHLPDAVIVQGDTTSALAGALAANATGVPLVHVEAGLRSFDRAMPEEHNRVLIDHLADLCCAPTTVARDNLLAERIPEDHVLVTGNTIVEAAARALPTNSVQRVLLDQLGVADQPFVLATFHRPENVDDPAALELILDELGTLRVPVVMPLHPRTRRKIVDFGLVRLADRLRLTEPLHYPDMLALLRNAAAVVSDSGGIQEEATVFKRPILIVRRSNERPEVEDSFGARVHPGTAISQMLSGWIDAIGEIHERLAGIPSPYGDGSASARIVRAMDQGPLHPDAPRVRSLAA